MKQEIKQIQPLRVQEIWDEDLQSERITEDGGLTWQIKSNSEKPSIHEEGKFTKGDINGGWSDKEITKETMGITSALNEEFTFTGGIKGRWFVEPLIRNPVIIDQSTMSIVAECITDHNINRQEAEANAAIICCAPEMLGIIKTVKFWFDNEANYPEGTGGYQIAQKAKSILSRISK